MSLKIGIAGAGMIATEIGPHLADYGYTVTAINGRPTSTTRTQQLADLIGAPTVTSDYTDFLAHADIDIVYLATPNQTHYDMAMQAVAAGKHVIVEKPITDSATRTQRLFEAARTRGVYVLEAISTIHLPNYTTIAGWLPKLGNIKIATTNYSQYSSRYDRFIAGDIAPAFDPACSGGALMDLGVYNLHLLIGLFGAPTHVTYSPNITRNIDTSGIALLNYDTFQAVSIAAKDCNAPIMTTIQGDNGSINFTSPTNNILTATLRLNDGTEETTQHTPTHRLEPEFLEFARIIREKDTATYEKLAQHSITVSTVLTDLRHSGGIVFPTDTQR